jgi:hypothetical protein
VNVFALLVGWFLAPFAIAAVALIARRLTPPEKRRPGLTGQRLFIEIAAGILYAAASLFMLAVTAGDVGAYENDPSCRQSADFSDPTASGACAARDATLTADWMFRRNTDPAQLYFGIYARTADDCYCATSASPFNSGIDVWKAAYAHPSIPARVQLFRKHPVLIQVDGASGPTDDLPSQSRFEKIERLAFGIGLILAALLEIALAPTVLKPGE